MIPMFFGTAQSYASKQALVTKWNMKKNGDPMLQTKGNLTLNVAENAQSEQKKQRINSIKAKLKSGLKLSNQELAYLKENNPQLYQKVLDSYRERDAYKKKLENCKTKDDVSKLQTQTLSQLASELSSASSNANIPEGQKLAIAENIQMRVSALQNEHTSFVGSAGYARLKWEYELDREEKAKAKKANTQPPQQPDEVKDKKEEEISDLPKPSPDLSEEESGTTDQKPDAGTELPPQNNSVDNSSTTPTQTTKTPSPNTEPPATPTATNKATIAVTATQPTTTQKKTFIARA